MIGDISPQLNLYNMHKILCERKKTTKGRPSSCKLFDTKTFENNLLRKRIIRPFLSSFLHKTKEHFNNIGVHVEYFVYTASDKTWAQFLIPHIEKALKIKFNRPILTRDDCYRDSAFQKSKYIAISAIYKSLKKRYPQLQKTDIEENFLMIDNNVDIFKETDRKRVIMCPTYEKVHYENVPAIVTEESFSELHKLGYFKNFRHYRDFEIAFYTKYVQDAKKEDGKTDHFFKKLTEIILSNDMRTLSEHDIISMKDQLIKVDR
jgi:hypothetical protein